MEQYVTKVSIGAAGGTAARGAKTYKITLPTTNSTARILRPGREP